MSAGVDRGPEKTVFEKGSPGRCGLDLPEPGPLPLDPKLMRADLEGFPEMSEPEVLRHYLRLSQLNYSAAADFYPLGSCTMKYNPVVNDKVAGLEGFASSHPYAPVELVQGKARSKVLIPASAHGTNPASAALCGYDCVVVPVGDDGLVSADAVRELLDDEVAGLMITNPNTLGLFELAMGEITAAVHEVGGLVYMDGANMNALLGVARPGDMGADILHVNLHKTFSTPHGGGGPGAGPLAVTEQLEKYLPSPRMVEKDGKLDWEYDRPDSIGPVRSFYGNFGILVRAWAYMKACGGDGLTEVTRMAVLAANYLRVRLEQVYDLPCAGPCMHEVVFTDKKLEGGVKTLDLAKRLLDYGFHAPTIYFPLVVQGAIMIEPTESEPLETLDEFADAMIAIAREAREDPAKVKSAPLNTPVARLDETRAARHPRLVWKAEESV